MSDVTTTIEPGTEVAVFTDTATGELVEVANQELAVRDAINALVQGKSSVFSSITGTDFASKLAVLNATTNSKPLAENLGKTIWIENIVVQFVSIKDQQNPEGPRVPAKRSILIDQDGTAYHAISNGVFSGIENLIGIVGQPHTWPFALPIVVTREGAGIQKFFNMRPDQEAFQKRLAEYAKASGK